MLSYEKEIFCHHHKLWF